MRRVHGNDMRGKGRAWKLPCLLLALALAGLVQPALAEPAQPALAEDGKAGKPASVHTRYRVVNLGSGSLHTIPKINAKGQVVFSLNVGPFRRGYFFNGNTTRDIGTLGGVDTTAEDLNDVGQVTGGSFLAGGAEHAYVWTEGGGMLDIGTIGGGGNARAAAINQRGVVTGFSEGIPFSSPRAFRWSASDGMEDLGAFTSGVASISFGLALNDAGLITGSSATADNDRHAFAWTRAGGLVDIDTLGSFDSLPAAVGAKGEVAGSALPQDVLRYRAFLWTPGQGMQDLGTAGGIESGVIAMNLGGHIVGIINLADDTQRAMSWTRARGMRDLGTLGGRHARAIDVNNKSDIVGTAANKAQQRRAVLWSNGRIVDLNTRLRHAPPGLVLDDALGINDSGAIVASSNAGLVLLKPVRGHKGAGPAAASAAPVLGPVLAKQVVRTGAPLHASVGWVDEDRVGTRSVSWSWGDGGGAQAGRVRQADGTASSSASHSYAAPGIYPVQVTVTDRNGRSTTVSRTVVVAAPSGGVVAGAGAVLSPPGALRQAPFRVGTASFALIAPVTAAARTAGTPARLEFDFPGLNFRSTALRSLGQQGAQRVFDGSGTIRGAGNYQFRLATTLAAGGGASSRFALKIWHVDPATGKQVLDYDNTRAPSGVTAGQVVDGGIVHE